MRRIRRSTSTPATRTIASMRWRAPATSALQSAGETIAETHRPHVLFETGLPIRYYIPAADIRMDLLEATPLHSVCPYKGQASYWKLKGGEQEVAWAYLDPIGECPTIKGLIAFYNERVDEVWVDGELEARPPHRWHTDRPLKAPLPTTH